MSWSTSNLRKWSISAAAVCMLAAPASSLRAQSSADLDLNTLVQKMTDVQLQVREQYRSYELLRKYQVFTKDEQKPSTEVMARIEYLPPDQKSYAIERSTGGMGERAIRHALDHEMDLTKDPDRIEMTERNYTFTLAGTDDINGRRCWILESHPKRDEKDLLHAKVWVDQQNYRILRIIGHPQKSPSFWVKDIDLELDYGEMGGMWMHTSTRAVAQIRFTGPYTVVSHDVSIQATPMVAKARRQHRLPATAVAAAVMP